jgi:hypothetical protein
MRHVLYISPWFSVIARQDKLHALTLSKFFEKMASDGAPSYETI